MRSYYILFLSFVSFLPFMVAQVTWDGGAGTNDWHHANNWNPNGVPTATEDVVIGNSTDIVRVKAGNNALAKSLDNEGDFKVENTGSLSIANSTGFGFKNAGGVVLINGILYVNNTVGQGIINRDSGSFEVGGAIYLSTGIGSYAIRNFVSSQFTNKVTGLIEITNSGNDAIYNFASGTSFDNYGEIIISDAITNHGISNRNNANFSNFDTGTISIDDTNGDGIYNIGSGSVFNSSGAITLLQNIASEGIYNTGQITNGLCGSITLNTKIDNQHILLNLGYIRQNYFGTNTNTGTLTNDGGIEDRENSFTSFTNNEFRVVPLTGSFVEGVTVNNALDKGANPVLTSTTSSWYTSPNLNTPAGLYDVVGNTWIPNTAAIGDSIFYTEITTLGQTCPDTMKIVLSSKVVQGCQELIWIGGTGNWNVPAHWDLGRVPAACDTVFINNALDTVFINGVNTKNISKVHLLGHLEISAASTLNISGSLTDGLYCSNGSLTNYGTIISNNAAQSGLSFEDDSDLINHGSISSDNCATHGIALRNESDLTNTLTGTIITSNCNIGLSCLGGGQASTLTNDGSIMVDITQDGVVIHIGSFVNNTSGILTISNCSQHGIYNTVTSNLLQNFGTIDISSTDFGITNFGSIANFTTGNIKIDNIMTRGIVCNGANFDNEGEIEITNCQENGIFLIQACHFDNKSTGSILFENILSNTIFFSSNLTTRNFLNSGAITAINNIAGGIVVYSNSNFVNEICGRLEINASLSTYFGGEIENKGSIVQNSSIQNINNNGTIKNSGIIEDIQNSFGGISYTNNEVRSFPKTGTFFEGDSIMDVFDKATILTLTGLGTNIYTDSLLTTNAGTYDVITNSWVTNSNAVGDSLFFIAADLIGQSCPDTLRVMLNTKVQETCGNNIWTGGIGDWDNSSNWSKNRIPLSCDTVLIENSLDQVTKNSGGYSPVAHLDNSGTLTLSPTAQLDVENSNNLGIRNDNGTINNNGILNLSNILDNAIYNTQSSTFTNSGTIALSTIIGGSGIRNINSSSFTNQSTGTININQSDQHAISNSGSGTSFTNEGIINANANLKSTGLQNNLTASFTNLATGIFNIANTSSVGISNSSSGTVFNNHGIINITSSIGTNGIYNSSALLENFAGGQINVSNTIEDGIHCVGGQLTNSGAINCDANIGENAIYCDIGTLITNNASGIISLGNTSDDCFFLKNSSDLQNHGSLIIDNTTQVGILMNSNSNITNHISSSIVVDNVDMDAISLFHAGTNLTNQGSIIVGTTSNLGDGLQFHQGATFDNQLGGTIDIRSGVGVGFSANNHLTTLTNSGEILIDNISGIGLSNGNLAGFTNNATGSILISNTTGKGLQNIIIGTSFDNYGQISITTAIGAIGLENGGNFTNYETGTIDVDDTASYGLSSIGFGPFVNKGQVNLLGNIASNAIRILTNGTIENNVCGKISCQEKIFVDGVFQNDGYLHQNYQGVNQVLGTVTNDGAIEDIHDSFNGVSLNNNEYIVAPLTGTFFSGDSVSNALSKGMSMGKAIISTEWYTDNTLITTAGPYNLVTNEWIPNNNAIGDSIFYMQINLLGQTCPDTMQINLSCKVIEGCGNITWIGGSGDWDIASNWDLNRLPMACDTVIVGGPLDDVSLTGAATYNFAKLEVMGSFTIGALSTVIVDGSDLHGILIDDGQFINHGSLEIRNANLSGIRIEGTNATFDNYGDIIIENAGDGISSNVSSVINLQSGSTLTTLD